MVLHIYLVVFFKWVVLPCCNLLTLFCLLMLLTLCGFIYCTSLVITCVSAEGLIVFILKSHRKYIVFLYRAFGGFSQRELKKKKKFLISTNLITITISFWLYMQVMFSCWQYGTFILKCLYVTFFIYIYSLIYHKLQCLFLKQIVYCN